MREPIISQFLLQLATWIFHFIPQPNCPDKAKGNVNAVRVVCWGSSVHLSFILIILQRRFGRAWHMNIWMAEVEWIRSLILCSHLCFVKLLVFLDSFGYQCILFPYCLGDFGHYDSDGFIYLVDRIKDLIKYKSNRVGWMIIAHLSNKSNRVDSSWAFAELQFQSYHLFIVEHRHTNIWTKYIQSRRHC